MTPEAPSVAALRRTLRAASDASARRRASRTASDASANARLALTPVLAKARAAFEDSAIADEDGDAIDLQARYDRKLSKGATRSESISLIREARKHQGNASAVNDDAQFGRGSLEALQDTDNDVKTVSIRPDLPDIPASAPLSRVQSNAFPEQFIMEEDARDTGKLASTRGVLIIAVAGVAQLLDNVSMTSVNISLPAIGKALDIDSGDLQWLISGYTLTFGGFLLLAGVLSDRYGKKLVFQIGMIWLSLFTLIDSFAQSEIQLIIFRALQGLGAAATVPSAIGILSSYFVGHDRNKALSIFGAFGAIGFVVGLIFGGILSDTLGWAWVFRIAAPLGFVVAGLGYFVLPKDKQIDGPKPALDFLGAGLGTSAMIILTFCLSSGGVVGWGKAYIIALIVVSVTMLAAFAYAEKKVKNPVMPLYLWKTPNFAATWVAGFFMYCWWQTVVMYLVLVAQEVNHLSGLQTAIRFVPMGVFGFITSICIGTFIARFQIRTLMILGMLLNTVTMIPIAIMRSNTSFWVSAFPVSLMGVVGISITYNTATIAMLTCCPPAARSLAGGLANTAYQMGGGIGLAIASAVAQAVLRGATGADNLLQSYQAAAWTCCGFAGVGLVLSVFGVAPGKVFVPTSNIH